MSALVVLLRLILAAFVAYILLPWALSLALIMNSMNDDGEFVGAMLGAAAVTFLSSTLALVFVVGFPIALVALKEFFPQRPKADLLAALVANLFGSVFVAFGPGWHSPPGVFLLLITGGALLSAVAAVVYWLLTERLPAVLSPPTDGGSAERVTRSPR